MEARSAVSIAEEGRCEVAVEEMSFQLKQEVQGVLLISSQFVFSRLDMRVLQE